MPIYGIRNTASITIIDIQANVYWQVFYIKRVHVPTHNVFISTWVKIFPHGLCDVKQENETHITFWYRKIWMGYLYVYLMSG